MYKGYKVRLYPTKEQEEILWKHIHACRFIWNYLLDYQIKNHKAGNKYLSAYDMSKIVTKLRKQIDYAWLNEVSITSLEHVCRDLAFSFQRYYSLMKQDEYERYSQKKLKHFSQIGKIPQLEDSYGFPGFKSRKHSKSSYPVRANYFTFLSNTEARIEKTKPIRTAYIVVPKGKISNPRISYMNNKWILSFGVECEKQAYETTDIPMGIDLGIKELAVVSFGDQKYVFHNINKSKRVRTLEHKLKYVQHVINRKYRTNGNYEKTKAITKYEAMASEISYKLSNIRLNYIHQTTHFLTQLMPKSVVMENILVRQMTNNKYIAKKVKVQGFYEFIDQMQYKCDWLGIDFVKADKWFPSSKMCSGCGNIKRKLLPSIRIYECTNCGLVIDRDYNAAINLMRYVSHSER